MIKPRTGCFVFLSTIFLMLSMVRQPFAAAGPPAVERSDGAATCDVSKQPVLLIPGGEGSSQLSDDVDGMAQLYRWMQEDGYVEGCNLFFASEVSALKPREENRQAMQRLLRAAYDQLIVDYTNFDGHFDLIGHSFGGLIGRFYLESAYYTADQSYGEYGIHIDNFFTLGTPHGGTLVPEEVYPGAMFIAGEHIFNPQDFEEFLAVAQLYSYLMDIYNFTHGQPAHVRYHLIGGDFMQQEGVPEVIRLMYAPFTEHPGDIGVSLRSAGQLAINEGLRPLYPRTCWYPNDDMHGYSESFGLGSLRSYVYPGTSYELLIRDTLGSRDTGCPTPVPPPNLKVFLPTVLAVN